MELLQLRYFSTVAKLENISRAAQYHMIPQSAMSKTISKLEHELGVFLFTRTKNKLALTEEGKRLYEGVRRSLFELDSALQDIQKLKSGALIKGEIKLLVLEHRYTLIDCIAAFKHCFPDVQFQIYHRRKDAVDYDMCISSFTTVNHEDICTPILQEELKIALPADHPLAGNAMVSLPELRYENFIFPTPESSLLEILTSHCARYGFAPQRKTFIDDLSCIEKYVSCGFGVAVVPAVSWQHLHFSGCVQLKVDEPLFQRKTFLFRNSLRPMNAAAEYFFEFLQQNFHDFLQQSASIGDIIQCISSSRENK